MTARKVRHKFQHFILNLCAIPSGPVDVQRHPLATQNAPWKSLGRTGDKNKQVGGGRNSPFFVSRDVYV